MDKPIFTFYEKFNSGSIMVQEFPNSDVCQKWFEMKEIEPCGIYKTERKRNNAVRRYMEGDSY